MLSSIGSVTATVIITGSCALTSDVLFPSNVTVMLLGAGQFSGTGRPTFTGFGIGRASTNSVLETFGNNGWPSIGGDRTAFFSRDGGLYIWDWLKVSPGTTSPYHGSYIGDMVNFSSDLGPTGITLYVTSYDHDLFQFHNCDAENGCGLGTSATRLTLTKAGVLAFGNKVNTVPALKPSGPELLVRRGDDSGAAAIRGTLLTQRTMPLYGGVVFIDAALGNEFVITATDSEPFTLSNPSNPSVGQRISIRVRNPTAGDLGPLTWDSLYKLATWFQPASGFSRTIDFQYDGANWIEASRTPFDVPN
jgi:hypothetical protein